MGLETRGKGLDKQGSLLGLLGLGTFMHVAPNIAMKTVKSTEKGHRALANTFAAGLEHGRAGKKLHPNLDNAVTYGIGPESMVEYRLGRKLGARLAQYPPDIQEKMLETMRYNVNMRFDQLPVNQQKELLHTPLVGSAKRYFDGEGEGKIKDFLVRKGVPEDAKPTAINRAVDVAMLGSAAAVDPHLLVQPAISLARKKTAESEFGQRFLKRQFENGENGVPLGRAKEILTDMVVSPGALDPYRVGRAMNRNVEAPDRERLKVVGGELLDAKKRLDLSPQGQYKRSLAGDATALLDHVDGDGMRERLQKIQGGRWDGNWSPPRSANPAGIMRKDG